MTDALGRVLETVVSRCQLVRFEPLPAATIAAQLVTEGVPADRAEACARLALGNAARARYLASPEGEELRSEVERLVGAALSGDSKAGAEPWRPLLARAEAQGAAAEEAVVAEAKRRLELEPKGRERRALERDFEEAAKRDARRARRESLELSLTLAALTFRDLICIAEDAPEAVLASDRASALAEQARSRDPRRLREAAERCEDVRQALELNVMEDVALSALGFRLAALAGAR
jgi:DNA polymerase-3 subunit delta'